MKKLQKLQAIAFISLLLLISCNKENNDVKITQTQNPVTTIETAINRVNNFRDKMHSTFKSSGKTLIDSAIWNLEALITYDLGHPDSVSGDFKLITTEYTVVVDSNNTVTNSNVQIVYNQLLDSIDHYLNQFNSNIKFVAFTDIELNGINGTTALLSARTGYGINTYHAYTPFEEDDDWIWGVTYPSDPPAGRCDGSDIGISDGSDELEWRLNDPDPNEPPIAKDYMITDIETVEVTWESCWYNEPPELPRVFHVEYDDTYCMESEELTFFLEAADWIIYDYNDPSNDSEWIIFIADGEGARPEGKIFLRIEIEDDLLTHFEVSNWYHRYYIVYGKQTNMHSGL